MRAVSEDPTITGYRHRKAALRQQVAVAGPEALMVFAADKLSKVRELRAAISNPRRDLERPVPPRRVAHLRACLGMLEERLGDSPLVGLLRSELAALNDDLKASATTRAAA